MASLKQGTTVLVTGGFGFIGGSLVKKLLDEGFNVVVLENFSKPQYFNVERAKSRGARVVKGDVRNKDNVEKALEDVDVVIHLAALIDARESIEKPAEYESVNVQGTLNMLTLSVKKDVEHFVFASSAAVYGRKNRKKREGEDENPTTPYGVTKLAGEKYCLAFLENYGLKTYILRFFNVYGLEETSPSSSVINKFARQALSSGRVVVYGDGEQTRDYVNVKDAVRAVLLAVEKGAVGEPLNVGTGVETPLNDVVKMLENALNVRIAIERGPPVKGELRYVCADTARAKERMGFEASISLEEGIRELVSIYRKSS